MALNLKTLSKLYYCSFQYCFSCSRCKKRKSHVPRFFGRFIRHDSKLFEKWILVEYHNAQFNVKVPKVYALLKSCNSTQLLNAAIHSHWANFTQESSMYWSWVERKKCVASILLFNLSMFLLSLCTKVKTNAVPCGCLFFNLLWWGHEPRQDIKINWDPLLAQVIVILRP